MRVQSDEARRHMQSRRIDRPVGVAGIDMPDRHDDAILDADVPNPRLASDRRIANNQIHAPLCC